jgi:hypothetical protein
MTKRFEGVRAVDTSQKDLSDGLFGEHDHAAGPPRPKHPEPPAAGVFGEHMKVRAPLSKEPEDAAEPKPQP